MASYVGSFSYSLNSDKLKEYFYDVWPSLEEIISDFRVGNIHLFTRFQSVYKNWEDCTFQNLLLISLLFCSLNIYRKTLLTDRKIALLMTHSLWFCLNLGILIFDSVSLLSSSTTIVFVGFSCIIEFALFQTDSSIIICDSSLFWSELLFKHFWFDST